MYLLNFSSNWLISTYLAYFWLLGFVCFRYSAEEKTLKMETLQEERQVVRAMRDTAELNKITAEQRLKHVLWVKKQETL